MNYCMNAAAVLVLWAILAGCTGSGGTEGDATEHGDAATETDSSSGDAADPRPEDPGQDQDAPDMVTDDSGLPDADLPDAPPQDLAEDEEGLPPGCEVLFRQDGLVHASTAELLKMVIPIPMTGPTEWRRIEVSLDVYHGGWGPKQGQYEVFTLLRGHRWTSNAIAYIAFVGPAERKTVMVANLDLPGAAGADGRRVTRNYAYEELRTYHLEYFYDAPANVRHLSVFLDGTEVTWLESTTTVSTILVPAEGFTLLLGGEEVADAPDCATLGWTFSNVVVTGCR